MTKNMIGTLYIVATPIGNMEDITVRAAKLLTGSKIVACEDTRRAGILLDHLRKTYLANPQIAQKPRLISYYEQNEERRIPEIIEILKNGQDVTVITDAGTPGISDPGFRIVRACREIKIPVIGIPGPSAAVLALSVSGLPTDKFTFIGYLPHKSRHAKKLLEKLKKSQELVRSTVILYEAPHKLLVTLKLLKEVLGDVEIVLARELTKKFEEVMKDKISIFLDRYSQQDPKGEFVILFHKI